MVVHSVSTLFMGPDAAPELMRRLNQDMFCSILPYARQYGIKVASETLGSVAHTPYCDFFGNANELLRSYDGVCTMGDNRHYLCTCVDTGHSNVATRFHNPSPADVIRLLGNSVEVLHLHDNDTFTDQHKPPMTGTIDWNDVLDALEEIGYTGNYNLKLNLRLFGDDMAYDKNGVEGEVER